VFDHLTRRAALLHAGSAAERTSLRREVIRALRGGVPGPAWQAQLGPAEASLSEPEFVQRVERTQQYIAAGDVYQLVLSIRFAGRCDLDPFEAYRALRLLNPSPYMYFCELGDRCIVGSSPEALVKLGRGRAQMRPIAGTRRRGRDAAEDLALEAELRADPKENAEHVMLVDLARNDLGRVATAGSVGVEPYRSIERYSHVMHIVSGVNGELAPGRDAFDLFAATFPAGTLVGAPKVRAMQIIDELEPCAAVSTAARSATSAMAATWTRPSRSARSSFTATPTASRRGPVSSPTACRPLNTPRCWRRVRCCAARSSSRGRGSRWRRRDCC
jgi:anthranilate synthase component 1